MYNFHEHKELSRNQRMKTLFFFQMEKDTDSVAWSDKGRHWYMMRHHTGSIEEEALLLKEPLAEDTKALGKRGRVQRTQFVGSRGSTKTQPYCAEQTERASFVCMTLAAACPQRRHCDSYSCSRALRFIGGFHFFPKWHVTSVENTFKMCLQMCQATYWPGAVVLFRGDHLE